MHIWISISIHSLFSHVLRSTITLQCTRIYMYTCFRCARNLYYANRFCRVLPRSKCYSSKTCLMCIICTLEYVRCSNDTMNNTFTLILLIPIINRFASTNEPLIFTTRWKTRKKTSIPQSVSMVKSCNEQSKNFMSLLLMPEGYNLVLV